MSNDPTPAIPPARSLRPPLIGITMGDPAGVGAEVIVKALADADLRRRARFVIYGIDAVLQRAAKNAGINPYWFTRQPADIGAIDSGVICLDDQSFGTFSDREAHPTAAGGTASLRFLDDAIEAARADRIAAIVTAPIHKVSWKLARCRFPGHTEKLADAFHIKRVNMLFVADDMRVALASGHVGLFDLRNSFTLGLVFQPIDLLATALTEWFGIENPKIAVAGLNPHAGEDGRFGDEEQRIITPAIEMARIHGIEVEGPFPADTLFIPDRLARYDGVIAMYHDQGLIPVKMKNFHSAVNVTLGLPIIRTSVDHGTAFDIANRNKANPGSMTAAINLAIQLSTTVRAGEYVPGTIPINGAAQED